MAVQRHAFAGGNAVKPGGQNLVGMWHVQHMTVDGLAFGHPVEIEIDVAGEAGRAGIVQRGGQVLDHQRVVVGQAVGELQVERAGEVVFRGQKTVAQFQRLRVRLGGVKRTVPRAARPAVNAVGACIGREAVFKAGEREARAADAPGVASHERPHGG